MRFGRRGRGAWSGGWIVRGIGVGPFWAWLIFDLIVDCDWAAVDC
jgi:hypothetical protein